MARIETAFDIPTGDSSGSVTEITPAVGADASALWSGSCKQSLTARVRGNQAALECGFVLPDETLLQHARDLTQLMESAWEASLDNQCSVLRECALVLKRQRDAARWLLSPGWLDRFDAGSLPF